MIFDWIDFEPETDLGNDDDRQGVYYITIRADGEEWATIIHRTTPASGPFPLDGIHAGAKRKRAQFIVDAPNAWQPS